MNPRLDISKHINSGLGRAMLNLSNEVQSKLERPLFELVKIRASQINGCAYCIDGHGQFRGADGVLVKENSFVLVLLYPAETAIDSTRKIEQIRRLYITQFQQESVLRVDDPFGVWVSF